MPVFDTECQKCKEIIEQVCVHNENFDPCPLCGGECKKIFGGKAPSFKLVYNNKTDMCDWSGNTSHYWDEYKAAKARGENVKPLGED